MSDFDSLNLAQLPDEPEATEEADFASTEDYEEAASEGEEAAGDAEDADEDSEVGDEDEIEYDGERYRVPKKLKDAFLRHEDYTRKTMEVAERAKAIEAEKQAVELIKAQTQREIQAKAEQIEDLATLAALDKQIKAFAEFDWDAVPDENQAEAQRLYRRYQDAKEQRDQLAGQIVQRARALEQERTNRLQQKLAEQQALLQKEIPNWGPEVATKLREFGVKHGFAPEELDGIYDARAVKVLHKAWLYDQLQSKQGAKMEEKKDIKPPKKIVKGQSSTKSWEQLSDKEFAARRRRQIESRGRR